jgi:RNA polymerase sigma-70 factor (ECF subfamily)
MICLMGREARFPDEREFDASFGDHYPELRRYVMRRLEDGGGAEDVLAETFAIAWRRRDQMPDSPLPWLFGICHKVIANHRRSAKRRARLLIRLTRTRVEVGRDPAEVLAERSEIGRAFSQLSDSQREVLRLVAWEGLGAADAASVIGCSAAAFRVRLHRARSELAKHLGEAGHERGEAPSSSATREGVQEAK